MKKVFKTAYAVALAGAMLSGSILANAGSANAQGSTAPAGVAKSPVTLLSDVKIERTERDPAGKEKVVLRDPKDVVVVPGDNVIFTLNVENAGAVAASGFRAINPIPEPVTFVAVSEDWAEVSVDGGATWGKLGTLTLSNSTESTDNTAVVMRAAAPEDVTHVRWVFVDAIAPSSKSSVSYRGVVK